MSDAPAVHTRDYHLEDTGEVWSADKAKAYKDVFLEFLNYCVIPSKERGQIILGGQLYPAQDRGLDRIFDGLQRGIHDFKWGKGRQQGISTICRPFASMWIALHEGSRGAFLLDTAQHMSEARTEVEYTLSSLPAKLRFPTFKSNRYGGRFSNGSTVTFLSAGVKQTAGGGALGRGQGITMVHASEVGTFNNPEGLSSFRKSLAVENPNRLFLWESTGRNVGSDWYRMWQKAVANDLEEATIFTGWYLVPTHRIRQNTAQFEKFGSPAVTREEAKRMDEVEERYGWKITREQLAWYRKETNPLGYGEDDSEDEDDIAYDEYQGREHPWCVTAETRVGTDCGMLRIADVAVGMNGTLGPVVAAMPMGRARIWKIRTSLGYELRGTYHHPVIAEDGREVWMRDSLNERVKLCPPRFADRPYAHTWVEGVIEHSVEITPDFARLVGLFMGDGSISGSPRSGYQFDISCDAKDQDIVAECHRLTQSLFGVASYDRTVKGGTAVRASSKLIYDTFKKLGLTRTDTGKTMRRVHVPEFIFRSPKPVVAEFLRGLFEADGFNGYGKPHVKLFSKYEEFIHDVQRLLLGFGITSRVSRHDKKVRDYTFVGYDLDLRVSETHLFHREIGFLSNRKRSRSEYPEKHATKGKAPRPIEFVDTVVSVEDTGKEEEVYNLTIEGDHLFDANGVLTHNTEEEMFTTDGSNFFSSEKLTDLSKTTASDEFKAWQFYTGADFVSMSIEPARHRRQIQLKIWEEPKPEGVYIVSADPAFGANEHNDRSAAQIMRCYADKLEQVGEFAATNVQPHQFAWVLASLMGWYKNTRLMLEINGPGVAVWQEYQSLKRIVTSGYLKREADEQGLKNFFVNCKNYLYTRPDAVIPGQGSVHWKTTGVNKVAMMERLRDFVTNGGIIIRSRDCIDELRVVTRDGDSIKAEGNDHDDRVLAMAMAVLCWEQYERRPLIASNRTRESEIARTRLSMQDQFSLLATHSLNQYFKGKQQDRRSAAALAARMAWRGR